MRSRGLAFLVFVALYGGPAAGEDESARQSARPELEQETIDQPPAKVTARANLLARTPGMRVAVGPYVSVQINVDANGQNIVGDAANETTIAVNPQNPLNIVVGWRQFDSVTSNFRQAGWAYTFNKGESWTFPGTLTPGTFRSDPVVDVNSSGEFFYQSLKSDFTLDVFKSTDGGATWGPPVPSFGGDKNWMAVDRSGGATDGIIYGDWQRFVSCCGPYMLTRSTNSGASFEDPITVEFSPQLGMLSVGPDGTLYSAGADASGTTVDMFHLVIAWPKFSSGGDGFVPPEPKGRRIDMGGYLLSGTFPAPNQGGLNGQVNVATDHSSGSTRGNVYVLASINPTGGIVPNDPIDVHIIRSTDSARNFTPYVRVNDDLDNNFQWFAAHAVAPNARIDAIWFDTRDIRVANASALYYAYSWDAGATWSRNVRVSPIFNSWVGWPQQNKIGDYMGIVSDATGADVAYPATFNNEEDVYYIRLFPDCNENGISDVIDIDAHLSQDCNLSHIPDECETAPVCVGAGGVPDGGSVPGSPLTIDRGPNDTVVLSWGASCVAADPDYAVYEGSLSEFASHAPRACTTGGARTFSLSPAAESRYYLVVPVHAGREGSYGTGGTGAERIPGIGACAPQTLHACSG